MSRQEKMQLLRKRELSYQAIGAIFGISRQRVHQLLSGYGKLRGNLRHKNGWYRHLHDLVLERDNHACLRCNATKNLVVHHGDGNNMNNALGNMVTLCSKCHLDLHRPCAILTS